MRKLWRALLALLLIALLVVGGPWALVQVLSFGRTWTSADEAPSNDVGLVMGAATLNGRPSGYLKARLDLALQLWEQGKITVFIVSGSTSDDEPAVMRAYLEENGVDPLDIVEDEGGNSYVLVMRAGQGNLRSDPADGHFAELPRAAHGRHLPDGRRGRRRRRRRRTAKNATWRSYERRELIANIKMIVDVVMKTDVGTLIYDPAVDEALARHR